MTGVLIERGNLDTKADRHRGKIKGRDTEREDGHRQAKEKGLEQTLPSWPLEGENLTDTLTLASRTETIHFCCCSHPSWWHLVIAALAN